MFLIEDLRDLKYFDGLRKILDDNHCRYDLRKILDDNHCRYDLRKIQHLGAAYDTCSVMHYGPYAFSVGNNLHWIIFDCFHFCFLFFQCHLIGYLFPTILVEARSSNDCGTKEGQMQAGAKGRLLRHWYQVSAIHTCWCWLWWWRWYKEVIFQEVMEGMYDSDS